MPNPASPPKKRNTGANDGAAGTHREMTLVSSSEWLAVEFPDLAIDTRAALDQALLKALDELKPITSWGNPTNRYNRAHTSSFYVSRGFFFDKIGG
mgnify:CR=1 FL=1